MENNLSKINGRGASSRTSSHRSSFNSRLSLRSILILTLIFLSLSNQAFAMGIPPQSSQAVSMDRSSAPQSPENSSFEGFALTDNSMYVQGNLTYDLTHVYDTNSRIEIIACLQLGYQAMKAGGKNIKREIANLQGTSGAKVIRFYSNEQEQLPGTTPSGAPATATWNGPNGPGDHTSPPSKRTDIRIYVRAGQPYWYLVNTVWHELLHTTLTITHSQTTPEGTMPAKYVNDGIWYTTIKGIMLDFPTHAKNPITGATESLYNVENTPWS